MEAEEVPGAVSEEARAADVAEEDSAATAVDWDRMVIVSVLPVVTKCQNSRVSLVIR